MSIKQKSRILTLLIIVAVVMLVSRIGQVIISLEKSGYINLPKIKIQTTVETVKPENQETTIINDLEKNDNIFLNAELSLIEDIKYQKELLEIKNLELERRELQLQLAAIELENKLDVINEAETRLIALVNRRNQQDNRDVSDLVRLYTNMNSKEASEIIENMDTEVAILLLKSMDTDTASSILSQMNTEKAKEISSKLVEPILQRKN